jgi:hypothetical protein
MHSASFIKSVVLALSVSHCAAGPIAKPFTGQDGPGSGNDLDERDVNIGTWIMTITPVTPTITTILVAPTTTPTQLEIPSELLPPPESKSKSQSHSKAPPKPPPKPHSQSGPPPKPQSHSKSPPKPPPQSNSHAKQPLPKPQSNSKSEPAPPPPPKGTKDAQNKSGPASAKGQSGPPNPPGPPANTATHDKGKPHSPPPPPPPPPPPAAASKTQAKGAPDACEDGEPAHNTVFDPVKVVVDPVLAVRNTFTLFGGPHPLIPHMTWRETVTTTLDEGATLPAQAGVDARNVHTTASPNSEYPILEVVNPFPSTTQTLILYRGAAPLHPHNTDRPTSTTTLGVPPKTPGCPPADKNPPPPPPPPPADTKNPPPPPPPPAKPKSSKRPGGKKPRPSAPPAKSNNLPSNKPPPAPANTHTPAAAPPKKPPTPGTPPPPPAAQTKNPPPPPANSNKPAATPAADTTTKNKPTTTETKFYDEPIGGDPFHFHREPYSEASIVMPSDFEPTTTSTPKGTVTEVINPFWSVTVWVMGITTMVVPPTADLVTVTSVPGYTQLNPTSITPIPASYVAHHGTDPVPEQDSTTSSTTTTPPPPPPPPTATSDSGFPQFLTLTGWPYFPPWTDPAIQWENDD